MPRDSRICCRTSCGIVIGRLPVGSLGAKSRMTKTTKLMANRVGMAVSKLGEELFVGSCIAQVLIMAPVCIAAHCALAAAHTAFGGRLFAGALGQAFWTGMYSGLVAPLVFWLLDKAASWLFVAPVGRSGPRRG